MKKALAIVEKAKDLGEGLLEAVVASSSKDRHGEILDIKGLDLSKYKDNPVVLWAHDYNKPPIGKSLSVKKMGDKLVAKIQFAINEDEFAHKIYKLYKGGYMKAFSIGFIPKEMSADGMTFTKSEMIEHSAVPVPANAEALALAYKKGILSESEVKSFGFQANERVEMTLKDILAKKPEDLTAEERAFLIENVKELSDAQKFVFKDVLPSEEAEETPAVEEVTEETPAESSEEVKSLTQRLDEVTKKLDTVVERKNINMKSSFSSKDVTKEQKTRAWLKGLIRKDFSDYFNIVGKDATAMDTSDTGAVLPPEELITEISRLEEEFGIAPRYANVRRTSSPTVRGIKGGDDLELIKTAELGLKAKQKTSYESYNLAHIEYTGIVPLSDTLLEDSAVDLFSDIAGRFARANAKLMDQLVFTQNDTDDDVYGILNATGTAQLSVGADIDAFDGKAGADKLNEMMYAVPTPSMTNGRFYLHRTVLGRIQRMKDDEGRYIWQPGINGSASGTIWGMPYSLTEVMPSLNEIEDGDPFLVFGDLRNTLMSIRVPMQTKFFDTGVITDSEGNVLLNLMQQDAQAVRVRTRLNQVHVHPEAYSVLVAGSLS